MDIKTNSEKHIDEDMDNVVGAANEDSGWLIAEGSIKGEKDATVTQLQVQDAEASEELKDDDAFETKEAAPVGGNAARMENLEDSKGTDDEDSSMNEEGGEDQDSDRTDDVDDDDDGDGESNQEVLGGASVPSSKNDGNLRNDRKRKARKKSDQPLPIRRKPPPRNYSNRSKGRGQTKLQQQQLASPSSKNASAGVGGGVTTARLRKGTSMAAKGSPRPQPAVARVDAGMPPVMHGSTSLPEGALQLASGTAEEGKRNDENEKNIASTTTSQENGSEDKDDKIVTSGYIPSELHGRTSDASMNGDSGSVYTTGSRYAGAYHVSSNGIMRHADDLSTLTGGSNHHTQYSPTPSNNDTSGIKRSIQHVVAAEAVAVVAPPQVVPQEEIERLQSRVEEMEEQRKQEQERVRQIEERERNAIEATEVKIHEPEEQAQPKKKKEEKTIVSSKRGILIISITIIAVLVAIVIWIAVRSKPDEESIDDGKNVTRAPSIGSADNDVEAEEVLPDGIYTLPEGIPPALQMIKERGYLKCTGTGAFLHDLCVAVSAAIFGTGDKLEFSEIPFPDVWPTLAYGDIDLSCDGVTVLMSRDVYGPSEQRALPMAFSTPYLYAGTVFFGLPEYVDCADQGETLQGICRDLEVCVTASTTNRDVVDELLDGSNYREGTHPASQDLFEQFVAGECNVVALDNLYLNETFVRELGHEGEYKASTILHSKDPLAYMTRNGDVEFGDFVHWILRALLAAEAMDITQETADLFPTTTLFGEEYENMFVDAIEAVGNYGELFERTLGETLPREGINDLNLNGDTGLLYSFPLGNIRLPLDTMPNELLPGPIAGGTLEAIAQRRNFRCGIVGDRPGLATKSFQNATSFENTTANPPLASEWNGLDVDFCAGLCSAFFTTQDEEHMAIVEFASFEEAFVGLANDDIDVLAGAPFNIVNDVKEPTTGQGFAFGPVYYYQDDEDSNMHSKSALATREDDAQWSDFVSWMTMATIYAEEEGITSDTAKEMPVIDLFGNSYRQALRDIIISIGNYGELYARNLENHHPRSGRNLLNQGGSPQLDPHWEF